MRNILSTFRILVITTLVLTQCSQNSLHSVANIPVVTSTARVTLGKDFGNKYFYQPKFDYPYTPERFGLHYDNVSIPSSEGVKLHGWLLHAKGGIAKSRHTIIYSHGNMGTVGYHLKRVKWMINSGFNVLLYDYRGYGKSTGEISRKGLIDDAYYAMVYASKHPSIKHTKLISHGHSLGGAKSIAALALYPKPNRLQLAINESSFASYQEMAATKAGNIGSQLVTETYSPQLLINKVSVPVILIHGTSDTLTPLSQAHQLRNAAKGSTLKYYWEVPSGSHYNTLTSHNNKVQKQLIRTIKSL